MRKITNELLEKYEQDFFNSSTNVVAMNAVNNTGIISSSTNYNEIGKIQHSFSNLIEAGDITNQKQSGRCWIFSSLNMMRIEVMKNLNLKTIELSQSYPLFFDKLEKSNYLLENIIETIDLDTNSREVQFLLTDPLQDGGQFDMIKNLIKKYGVVPKDVMPESNLSSATSDLDKYLTTKLREFSKDLRNAYKSGKSKDELYSMKDEMMNVIYRMISICLGTPPKKFTFETRDKDNNFIRIEDITPQEFFEKYVNINLDDYVSIINSPTNDKPFNKTYTVKFLGNVYGDLDVKYLNLEISELKKLAIKQLKDNKSVWFGSDVSQFSLRKEGILSPKIIDIEQLFSTQFNMTKGEKLDYAESKMNHAMLLTGVNLDDEGNPNRYRVENSWGEEVGKKGFYVMDDEWFDNYVYQIVIDKKYLSEEQLKLLEQEPIVLPPWDPMGSLAI